MSISIHAPHEGERPIRDGFSREEFVFQSTLPTRGSDSTTLYAEGTEAISIHAPHEGERPEAAQGDISKLAISIHAPHEGERLNYTPIHPDANDFNPRSPRGGATEAIGTIKEYLTYFNPRSPRGGATFPSSFKPLLLEFQSTLPTRGSDAVAVRTAGPSTISIHAPHEGERRRRPSATKIAGGISIHAPHEGERPVREVGREIPISISIHAPHEGERQVLYRL